MSGCSSTLEEFLTLLIELSSSIMDRKEERAGDDTVLSVSSGS